MVTTQIKSKTEHSDVLTVIFYYDSNRESILALATQFTALA